MFVILVFVFTSGINLALSELRCTDFFGKEILNGQDFQPKSDPCYQCSCSDGFPTMCKSVSCNPPTDCHKPVMIKGTCCQFSCMDNGGGQGIFPTTNSTDPTNKNKDDGSSDNMTTLGLRLVASTITSFLVLALLLFMGHRLRQRRLLQAMRRYRDNRRRERLDEGDVDSFSPEFLGFECPSYDDPPPPYTPPKPQDQVFPREAPPPYEAVDTSNNNNNASSPCPNNNIGCQTSPHTVQDSENSACSRGAENVSTLSNSCNQMLHRHHSLPGYSDRDSGPPHSHQNSREQRQGSSRFSFPWLRQSRQAQRGAQTLPTYNRHTDQVNFSPDLFELWEDTSTATTTSEFQDHPRLPLPGSRCVQPPHIAEISDTDDLSTESGNHADQYVQTSRHSYGSLPMVSTFNSNRSHPPSRRESSAVPDVSSVDEVSFHGSETRSMGMSHSSYNHSLEGSNNQCVGATNILENDSVLEAEDNIRKMEQIYDSQNLRILRLSKLLHQNSDSSDSACGYSCMGNYPKLQKSQSSHSGLSVCSETGEKKLPTVEESALSNDVQYPCSGRMPSRLTHSETLSSRGISDPCGSSDCSSLVMPTDPGECESGARFSPISQHDYSYSPQSLSSRERNSNSMLNSSSESATKADRGGQTKLKKHKRQSPKSKLCNDQSNGNYNKNARLPSAPARQLSFIDELKSRNQQISDGPPTPLFPDSNGCSQSSPTYNDSSEICDSHWHSAKVKRNNSAVSHKSSSQSSSHSSHSGDGLLICPRKKKSRPAKRIRSKKTSDKRKSVQDNEPENAENKQCSLV